jgi:CRISPR-associated protein Csh1
MIKALKEIGELWDKAKADYVVILDFDRDGKFVDVNIKDFSEEKLEKYLFRKSKTNNPPTETPILNLNLKDIEKSLKNLSKTIPNPEDRKLPKIPQYIKNIKEYLSDDNKRKDLAEDIKEKIEEIKEKIKGNDKGNDEEKHFLLTIRIDGKFLGEIDEYQEFEFDLELYEYRIWDKVDADYVVILDFDRDGKFSKLYIKEFSKEELEKYLFRKSKASNPPTETPTLILNLKDIENSKDIEKSLKNLSKTIPDPEDKKLQDLKEKIPQYLKNIKEYLSDGNKQEDLAGEIKEKIKGQEKEKLFLLTIRIDGKFLGEIDEYQEFLKEYLMSEYENESYCAVCGNWTRVKAEIPFYFLTFDKPGYVVGGLNEKFAYKNSPICFRCFEKMRIARQELEEAKFDLAGLKYLIIPESLNRETLGRFIKLLKHLKLKEFSEGDKEDFKMNISELVKEESDIDEVWSYKNKGISGGEGLDLLVIFGCLNDVIWANFLFIEKEQSRESIKLYINEIFPSRVSEMFGAKDYVEKLIEMDFDFNILKGFFSKNDFYNVIGAVFVGKNLEKNFLYSNFMAKIREDYHNNKDINPKLIREAFISYVFIRILTECLNMNSLNKPENLEEFFKWIEDLPTVKGERWKRALILMGFLTEYILAEESRERGSKPFLKKLKGFRMRWKDIEGLLTDIRNKLEILDLFDYESTRKIFATISENITSGEPKATVNEINFYFVVGMGLYHKFKDLLFSKKEKEGGEHEHIEESA